MWLGFVISFDEFCNFYIFTYDGIFGEAEHSSGLSESYNPQTVSSSVYQGSGSPHPGREGLVLFGFVGLKAGPVSPSLAHQYPSTVAGSNV